MPSKKPFLLPFLLAALAPAVAAPAGPCEARSLAFDDAAAGWKQEALSKLKRDTVYTVSHDADGHAVLHASADRSASMYATALKPMSTASMTVGWRWKTDALVPGADSRDKSKEDAPLRVILLFDGDVETLSEAEQRRFRLAKTLSGHEPPFATLMYLWTDLVPVGTVIPSAHTEQVRMIAVASGSDGLGAWHAVKRNVAEDYRHAYGSDPGPLVGIAVMTDTDNTGTKAVGEYADIAISCGG
jgi:hypothetical protein